MNVFTCCELVYIHQGQDDSGNTVLSRHNKHIKCTVMDSFSLNYYQNQSRDMRSSKNIVIAKPYTLDQMVDGERYRLEEVLFNGCRYLVKNILLDRNSAITSILDCEEMMSE